MKNTKELLKALLRGEKITYQPPDDNYGKRWKRGVYIQLNKEGILEKSDGETFAVLVRYPDFYWEIWKDK